jgi:hypothetical protein
VSRTETTRRRQAAAESSPSAGIGRVTGVSSMSSGFPPL